MTTSDVQDVDAAVARVLRGEAAKQNLGRPALSALSGVPLSTLVTYLDGETAMKIGTVARVASALGHDVFWVMDEVRRDLGR